MGNKEKRRVFLIVLDSFGIGKAPDADKFGDEGSDTLLTVSKNEHFSMPNMGKLGFFNIDEVECGEKAEHPLGSYARISEASMGKDSTIGHWEIAGVESPKPLPTYPNGFPEDVIKKFEELTGRKVLCNKPYSGTQLLDDYGEEHMKTGDLLVYTSGDSVFQIAAHEDIVPVEQLYEYCRMARKMLTESGEHAVGRVIARPFVGTGKGHFTRTKNRHDYSLRAPGKTALKYLEEAGKEVIAVGKIYDLFDGEGITDRIKTANNVEGMEAAISLLDRDFNGLAFINLVDFDMIYGHRNDVDGYAKAATTFDKQLAEFLPKMRDDDVLMITADHGCDPGTPSTDHSRECVPYIVYGKNIKQGHNIGTIRSYSHIGSTVCDYLGVESKLAAPSVLAEIINE